jgi:hypothetical protein
MQALHTMLPHNVKKVFSSSIVLFTLVQQPWKRKVPFVPKQMNIQVIS